MKTGFQRWCSHLSLHMSQSPRWLVLALVALIWLLAACAPSSGILAGGSWESTGLQGQHIRSLAVSAADPALLYAGDLRDGVFASSDAGQHWVQRDQGLPLPVAINALGFDATNQRLYAATDRGVFVSTDEAQHWRSADQGLPVDSCTALAFDLDHSSVLYAGTAHHGVFVSTDSGAFWQPASVGLPAGAMINDLAYSTDQQQLWAATTQGVYRSDDGGRSWQALNQGLPSDLAVYTLRPASMAGGDSALVYAGTAGGFFLSHDDGAHWERSQETLARVAIRAMQVDFRAPTTLYIGTSIGVFRSTDSGEVWSGVVGGLPRGRQVYALALGAPDYAQLYAAADDVYEFPGSSGGWNGGALVPLLMLVAFFTLLYWFAGRNRRGRRRLLSRANATQEGGASPSPQQADGSRSDASSVGRPPPGAAT
jgi:photosystem II stability/assembly factor-like uncharacterized protein